MSGDFAGREGSRRPFAKKEYVAVAQEAVSDERGLEMTDEAESETRIQENRGRQRGRRTSIELRSRACELREVEDKRNRFVYDPLNYALGRAGLPCFEHRSLRRGSSRPNDRPHRPHCSPCRSRRCLTTALATIPGFAS
jgi:hypothetical protein